MRRATSVESAPASERLASGLHDASLVDRVAAGDSVAFESLYRLFYPRLRRFIERMTRRPQLVDEILDDTMLVVWRKAGTYDLSSKVSTWIFAIAFRKSLKALKGLDEPVDADPDLRATADGRGPDGALLGSEVRTLLGRALETLSPEQRAVVELTYFQGCGYREIASILDCPVDTVKTRMFHARRKLKVLLAPNRGDLR
jgi:RNA polymerase sigma-70 factor (ECF subfamily)